jgi:hypothetical protein
LPESFFVSKRFSTLKVITEISELKAKGEKISNKLKINFFILLTVAIQVSAYSDAQSFNPL